MRIKILNAFILLFFFSGFVFAKEIKVTDAKKVAVNFYSRVINQYYAKKIPMEIEIAEVFIEKENKEPVYYIFNFKEQGFIIISGDDIAYPVLGYSFESSYQSENQPPSFKYWMKNYKDEIVYLKKMKSSGDKNIDEAWNDLLSDDINNVSSTKGTKSIAPLLTTTWDQGKYYNEMCPIDMDGPGGRVWAGCVATAMAQIMNYYKYPLQGKGTHSYNAYGYGVQSANFGNTHYNWTAMTNSVNNKSNFAIAELLYHCGVSVNMNYSPNGSGAYSANVVTALKEYFNYSSSAYYISRSSYSTTQWQNILKSNLDNKKPIYYDGSPSSGGGHAFVCDGYQGTDYFHFNWGWSGNYDGYFYLNNLNPGSYTFNYGHDAVINIYPGSGFPYYCTGNTTLTALSGVFGDGSATSDYQNNSNCSWLIAPNVPDIVVDYITLDFGEFDLANNDSVIIYDGATIFDSILGAFSGSTIPPSVVSTGDSMLVNFFTDGSKKASGWTASYKSTMPVYCQGLTTLTTSSGIVTDGSGDNNYNNNGYCRWIIRPPNATSISIKFTSFDIEPINDFVRVIDYTSPATLLGHFSGSDLPPDLVSSSGEVWVIFMTNDDTTHKGFSFNYSSVTGIDENMEINDLKIYPNPADEEITVNFILSGENSLQITVLNPLGKTVYKEERDNYTGHFNETIDLSAYSKGIYFLQIRTQKSIITRKLIIE